MDSVTEAQMLKERAIKYLKTAAAVIAVILCLAILSGLLFPFTAAWLTAFLFRPVIHRLNRLTGLSRRFFGAALLLLTLISVALLLFKASSALFSQAKAFLLFLYNNSDSIILKARSALDGIAEKIPALEGVVNADAVLDIAANWVKNILSGLSASSASAAAKVAASLPSILFGGVVFVIAAFYICMDFDSINAYLISLIPEKYRERHEKIKNAVFDILRRYVRAYLILFVMTMSLLLFFLLLMRTKYAFIISFAASFADMLPAIGVGMILLPWAAFMFMSGYPSQGVWLLVTYAAVTTVRRIAEPHVLGANFGIHPLASLAAVYVGYKLCGLSGMLIGPAVACIAARLAKPIAKGASERANDSVTAKEKEEKNTEKRKRAAPEKQGHGR